MEKISNLFNGVTSILIVVLIITATVIPIVQISQEDIKSTAQNATVYYSMIDIGEDVELTLSVGDSKILINGEDVSVGLTRSMPLFMAGDLAIFANGTTGFWVVGGTTQYYAPSADITVTTTAATSSYVVTWTGLESDIEGTYSKAMYLSKNGTYGAFTTSTTSVYLNHDATAYYCKGGYTAGPSQWFTLVSYNKTDGFNYLIAKTSSNSYSMSNTCSVSTIEEAEYADLVSFTSVVKAIKIADETETPLSASGVIIAPIDYTVVTDSDSVMRTMLGIIPIMMLLLPIFIVVRLISNRSD